MSDVMERTDSADRGHDTVSEHQEVIRAIEPAVADNLRLLVPIDKAWQPADYLPDLEAASWRDEVERFRTAAEAVSDELLVVLVGDMITEEALPSYSGALNGLVKDDEGTSPAPWARWLRGWTAEENRHGDLLNAYLRLTGRVHMRAVERTIHGLVANGFNPQSQADPYSLHRSSRSTAVCRPGIATVFSAASEFTFVPSFLGADHATAAAMITFEEDPGIECPDSCGVLRS